MTFDGSVDDACRQLYAVDPSTFLARRTELVASIDDEQTAAAVKALRKPTLAAWIVNAHVAAHPDAADSLTDLGDRLRQAHADLDTATMRELSLERRKLVAEVTAAALRTSDRAGASQTVRDDVSSTFDAAVADPEIAGRLGRLQQPEHWSGFGVAVSTSPGLSLVPAARDRSQNKQAQAPEPEPVSDRIREKLRAAEEAFTEADEAYGSSQEAEDELTRRIRRLTTKLSTIQHDLEQARRDLDGARRATKEARRVRRTARSVLDRAERTAGVDSTSE